MSYNGVYIITNNESEIKLENTASNYHALFRGKQIMKGLELRKIGQLFNEFICFSEGAEMNLERRVWNYV